MGSNQADQRLEQTSVLAFWALPVVAAAIALLIALSGDTGREWLSLYRPAIQQGEVWRLLSAHFVHLGWSHVLLNVAGLLLIWYLVGNFLDRTQWLLVSAISVVGLDLGLWFLEPQLLWYVGLSGLLHALLAAGVVAGWRSGRIEIPLLGIVLVAKIAYEQIAGPLPGSEDATGGAVIVASHLYGALAGTVAAGFILIRVRARASI